jgi:hypothetical protein
VHAIVFCQAPVESQVCTSLPLHRTAPGVQVPEQAPFEQTNGQFVGVPHPLPDPQVSTEVPTHCDEPGVQSGLASLLASFPESVAESAPVSLPESVAESKVVPASEASGAALDRASMPPSVVDESDALAPSLTLPSVHVAASASGEGSASATDANGASTPLPSDEAPESSWPLDGPPGQELPEAPQAVKPTASTRHAMRFIFGPPSRSDPAIRRDT